MQPGTTYYFWALASSTDGQSRGSVGSFTTTGFPLPAAFSPPGAQPLLSGLPVEPPVVIKPLPSAPKLTNAQRLAKALKVCRRVRRHPKRVTCERQARRRYPVKRKK